MRTITSPSTFLIAATLGLSIAHPAFADAPNIQTNGPIIHLADNLNEEASLGWCIDTDGRDLTDLLHAHSCKPTGGDVLFTYAAESGMIQSATYADMCMAYNAPDNAENPIGLIACDETDEDQQFDYDEASMEIRLGTDMTQCVAVGATIDEAGPYQSRDLIVTACDELGPDFKQWVVQE